MPWFAMRSLKRPNALRPDYQELADSGFEVFTPMRQVVRQRAGRRTSATVPVLADLLFVNADKAYLDPAVAAMPTLQYRYRRGQRIDNPLTVRDADMERFIRAVTAEGSNPRYYAPDEITPDQLGSAVRIIGGPLDGVEARLLKVRGSRRRRIVVDIPSLLAASVEVTPELIELL